MKVLLVRPPTVMGEMAQSALQHPLGLLYLAAALECAGHEAQLLDLEVEPLDLESFADRVLRETPAVLGFTAMTPHINVVETLARAAKKVLPTVFAVAGGPHPSALPERTLTEFASLDAVVFGEGELTLVELADRLASGAAVSGLAGAATRRDGAVAVGPRRPVVEDLDRLAPPARHLLDLENYAHAAVPGLSQDFVRITQLLTSRGCPYGCIFCASRHTLGRKLRLRSAGRVVQEVRQCMDHYGFNHFSLSDDQFTMDRKRTAKLLEGIRRLGVSWDCDARVDLVDAEMLGEMARSGCKKVGFGVEAGSPRILGLLQKGITIEQVIAAFRDARRAGLMTAAYFMIGAHPDETEDDVWASIKLAASLRADFATFSVAVPLPGTALYEMMRSEGLIDTEDWTRFTYYHGIPAWRTRTISAERLVELQRTALRKFFFSPGYVVARLKRLTRKGERTYWLRGGLALLRYLRRERSSKRRLPAPPPTNETHSQSTP
jgi:anaerobic magnesium-protoporphyrin IX monomethyl ester cyclase